MPIESSTASLAEAVCTAGASAGRTVDPEPDASRPVDVLGRALAGEGIPHCHWPEASEPVAESVVDLLILRPDVGRVAELFARLGFKAVKTPAQEAVPVLEGVAYDTEADRLIRIRARHELRLGHALTANYHVPFEASCVNSAVPVGAFKVPGPEHELVLLVLGMVLGQSVLDILLGRTPLGRRAARLTELQARTSPARVRDVLERDLPGLKPELFDIALESLRPGATRAERLATRLRVLRGMQVYARRSLVSEIGLRVWRRASWAVRRRLLGRSPKRRLASGGGIIAIVGGDGAGKSTVVEGLSTWLSDALQTSSVHMGKPRWSWLTTSIRAVVKIGQLLGLYPPESSFRETLQQKSFATTGPWLVREICRARDRYAKYLEARRSAGAGALVISDRFPLPQVRLMDGPLAQRLLDALDASGEAGWLSLRRGSRVARAVVKREESYYRRYTAPEVLIVLRVDPEIAAQRRAGEDVIAVRERSTEIWQVEWQGTRAHVIDAGQAKGEVLAEAKAIVWAEL